MSAIAGYLSCGGKTLPGDACSAINERLASYGPHDQAILSDGPVAFGRNLYRTLPEDQFDSQPERGGGGRFMLVADVRLDNRREVADRIGLSRPDMQRMCDAALVLGAWERLQEDALDLIVGDYALALWDAGARRLSLVRSPLAMKPLYYHIGGDFVAFATMPSGLHALQAIPRSLDLAQMAAEIAGSGSDNGATLYRSIRRVEPGHIVHFEGRKVAIRRFWDIERSPVDVRPCSALVEEFREHLDRAVQARLRRIDGCVASHLSCGRDSSAVATTAARLLSGDRLLAFTSAPRAGYDEPIPSGRLADESRLAEATARMHPNIEHIVSRPNEEATFVGLSQLHKLHQAPLGDPANFAWWRAINQEASRRGSTVLLSGGAGNFALSAGGESHLVNVLGERGLSAWWTAAVSYAAWSPRQWRSVLNQSLGPRLPRSVYSLILAANGRSGLTTFVSTFLRSPYRGDVERNLRDQASDRRPPKDPFDYRAAMLRNKDYAEKLSLVEWGIDARDPSADIRLIKFCFSLPIDGLVDGQGGRPIFDAAMADRIPAEVLASRLRGYQGADWHEQFRQSKVAARFAASRNNPLVQEIFDCDAISAAIDDWPMGSWNERQTIYRYRNEILSLVESCEFIADVFTEDEAS